MSYSGFQENYNNPFSKVGKGITDAEYNASNLMSKFRNNRFVSGGSDFLNSNSLVAKVCFLILIILLFIMAIRIWTAFFSWLLYVTIVNSRHRPQPAIPVKLCRR